MTPKDGDKEGGQWHWKMVTKKGDNDTEKWWQRRGTMTLKDGDKEGDDVTGNQWHWRMMTKKGDTARNLRLCHLWPKFDVISQERPLSCLTWGTTTHTNTHTHIYIRKWAQHGIFDCVTFGLSSTSSVKKGRFPVWLKFKVRVAASLGRGSTAHPHVKLRRRKKTSFGRQGQGARVRRPGEGQ